MESRADAQAHADLDDATVARYAAIAAGGWASFAALHALNQRPVTALTHLVPAAVSLLVFALMRRSKAHRPSAILMLALGSLGGLASAAIVAGDPGSPAVILLALVPLLSGVIRIAWLRWTVLTMSLLTAVAVPLLSSGGHAIEPLVLGTLETTFMTLGIGLLVFAFGNEWRVRADAQVARLAAQQKVVEKQRAKLEAGAAEISRARDEALRASAAKSRFVAMTSHEIRGPLNGLVGLSHALSDTELSTHQRAIVQALRASSDALTRVVGELLDVARIEAGKIEITPTRVDVRQLIDDVVDTFAAGTLDKNVELLAIAHKTVPELAMLDGARLRQAIANLVGNAIKFTDRGHVRVVAHADAGTLEILVADTGRGISAQDRERLFAPFEQVSDRLLDRQAGTGLGLWLTRNFVQAMRGTLEVRSEVGLGTTFVVRLPLEIASVPDIDRPSALPPAKMLGIVTSPLVGQALVTSATRLGLECDVMLHDAAPPTTFHECVLADVDDAELEEPVLALAQSAPANRVYLAASPRRLARAEALARRHKLAGVLLKPFRSERVGTLFGDVSARRQVTGPVLAGQLLVVDDEPINRVVARHLAEAVGLTVFEASSGVEALAWLDAHPCDVVLMDMHLDGIDGAETAERIRARFPTRPIIVGYSGLVRDEDRARFHRAGVSEVLGKPLERTTFETVLRAAIGRIRRRESRVGMRAPSIAPVAVLPTAAALASSANGAPIVVDVARLRELVKLVGEAQAKTLATDLHDGLDERVARITTSAREGQGRDLAAAAHNLASVAAMFGLSTLAERCREAEREAEGASPADLERLGHRVAETVRGSRAALERALADWPS